MNKNTFFLIGLSPNKYVKHITSLVYHLLCTYFYLFIHFNVYFDYEMNRTCSERDFGIWTNLYEIASYFLLWLLLLAEALCIVVVGTASFFVFEIDCNSLHQQLLVLF